MDRGLLWIFGFHGWLLWGSFGRVKIFHGNVKSTENQFLLRFFGCVVFRGFILERRFISHGKIKIHGKKNYNKILWIYRTHFKTIFKSEDR